MEEAPVVREEKGPVTVLTMQYRPHNLLGPTLLGAIADEIGVARDAGSRAIILRSGLRRSPPALTSRSPAGASSRAAAVNRRPAALIS